MKPSVTLPVFFLILLLFPGCIKKQDAVTSAEKMQKDQIPAKTEVPATPQHPQRPVDRADTIRKEGRPQENAEVTEVKDSAFFARRDRWHPVGDGIQAMDYELGVLAVDVPAEISDFLQILGDQFPGEAVSPAWRDHMARQIQLFPAGSHRFVIGSIEEKNGKILAPFKIIRDNQLILGSLWAEMDQEGRYRIQDITLDQHLSEPFTPMDFPVSALKAFPAG